MSATAAVSKPLKTNHMMKRLISYALLALVFFLLGFLPGWVKSLDTSGAVAAAHNQLSLAQMQNSLGSAVIDVQQGNYAPALIATSSFFTALRARSDPAAGQRLADLYAAYRQLTNR
jgi:hypothetical protein